MLLIMIQPWLRIEDIDAEERVASSLRSPTPLYRLNERTVAPNWHHSRRRSVTIQQQLLTYLTSQHPSGYYPGAP